VSKLVSKAARPEINQAEPWADDIFERKDIGERLTRLIANTPDGFVLAVKAPFGAGKSVFLERFGKHLQSLPSSQAMPVVSIDAWGNDHYADPFEALLVALAERISCVRQEGRKADTENAIRTFLHIGSKLLKLIRPVLAIKTLGVSEGAMAIATPILDNVSTTIESGEGLLELARERKTQADEFKESLLHTKNILCKDLNAENSKLVFIIDELDRCRPDFAIKMLERIKHFFAVPGVVFVLALDNDNLNSAVQSVYGPTVNGERYLRKFFDMEFYLPRPSYEAIVVSLIVEHGHTRSGKAASLEKAMNEERDQISLTNSDFDNVEISAFAVALVDYAKMFGLSLRDVIQAMTALSAIIRSSTSNERLHPYFLTLGICLRFGAPTAFQKIISEKLGLSTWLGQTICYDGSQSIDRDDLIVHKPEMLNDQSRRSAYLQLLRDFGSRLPFDINEELRRRRSLGHSYRSSVEGYLADNLPRNDSVTLNQHIASLMQRAGQFIAPEPKAN
jgi:KAP family P-loop domain